MGTRREALKWFASKFAMTKNKTFTSKYYLAHESWPKVEVWWLQISSKAIDKEKHDFVNFICQTAPLENDFYYFKVPVKFFLQNLGKFHQSKGKLSLYLSANPETLFVEIRGKGRLDFKQFLVE